ncbi:hypothetical protein NEMBOFW57_009364 [Staphylotrichum longicolle]|uniref:Uncharacterized protein n=1 Tax=Staphylotrichum longicolle TaxID=669026 RepID=A0AAD4ESX7_9PEZI|nr:hypothetical protein NEMBOFW57_009364 [Staphylotrichum longicolle]
MQIPRRAPDDKGGFLAQTALVHIQEIGTELVLVEEASHDTMEYIFPHPRQKALGACGRCYCIADDTGAMHAERRDVLVATQCVYRKPQHGSIA